MADKKIVIISIVAGVVIIGVGGFIAFGGGSGKSSKSGTTNPTSVESSSTKVVSKAELAAADGKNGNRCFVAVDGTVYEISAQPQWRNGSHIPSAGQAYCGADMSKVIDKAPHGRKVLDELDIIGKLGS